MGELSGGERFGGRRVLAVNGPWGECHGISCLQVNCPMGELSIG